ncbi:MAG: iron-containing alcohol dehydrogenase [Alphaproteobacteria bacterium]|nr:iron-containing alcohol dehydrogenase [Alphaproteobacteria bacterium]
MIFHSKAQKILNEAFKTLPTMVMVPSLAYDVDELLHQTFSSAQFAVVDDVDTSCAFGDEVFRALRDNGALHITLPRGCKADSETIADIRERTKKADVLVAVGSGTINDLCKYAAFLDKKPYAVFPTAASMNGYLSANASISENGHKTTFKAKMPEAVFCDMSVIASAPIRLAKSGLGDSLARSTAQADWLLSHLLLGTEYNLAPFEMLAPLEPELHDNARGIALADTKSIELLLQTLLLSGLGMTLAGGSYPASQGEHMIAHTHEMLAHKTPNPLALAPLHGEEIALTTLYMAGRQESLLRGKPRFANEPFNKPHMTKIFGYELAEEFDEAFQKKLDFRFRGNDEIGNWHDISEKISRIALPSQTIAKILEAAQISTSLKSIGWSDEDFKTATEVARFTRDRFTFLDLA